LAFGIAAAATYSMLQESIALPDLSQRVWINWTGRSDQIPQYSFASVVKGEVPNSAFRHKIVVVGVTASATDAAATPFDRNPPANGVHLQATLIDNLLQKNALTPIAGTGITLFIFAIGVGFSLLLSRWRIEIQIAIASFTICLWVGASVVLLNANYLPPVILPIGLMIASTIAAALVERTRVNIALQRQVNQLQQRYEPDLVTRLIENLDRIPSSKSIQQVTQLSQLADQLGRSQENQAAIARNLPIGLIACDPDGQVWFCNPIAAALLNIEVGSQLEPVLVPAWLSVNEWGQALAAQTISTERLRQEQWFCLEIEPLKDQTGDLLIVIEEITIRKSIESGLDDQIHQLQHLSELKDEFLSTVSHELRTPLTNMKMAIQLLKLARTDTQKEHYLKILDNECNREADLVNTLLDLQRLESGRQTFEIQPIELQTWLPELLEPFDQRTESRQQSFTISIDPNLSTVYSDRAALERILVELMNNACKYTPPDQSIVVSAEWVAPYVELKVKNSGVEIAIEAQSKIFERFYRVPKADHWKQGGSGLGLALVQKLVESLGGTIEVASANHWTVFTVKLLTQSTSIP
jgi:signal transduction histidine kinase